MKRTFSHLYINHIIGVFGLLIVTAVWDLVLKLGNFHGLVFMLYSFYGAVIIFLIDIIVSIVFLSKGNSKKSKEWLIAGILFLILTLLLLGIFRLFFDSVS